jgi:hypothetical protein
MPVGDHEQFLRGGTRRSGVQRGHLHRRNDLVLQNTKTKQRQKENKKKSATDEETSASMQKTR